MKSTYICIAGIAALGIWSAPVFAQNSSLTPNELNFVRTMAQGNIDEIELGRVAQSKATTPTVRDFANRMVQDHTTLNDQLKSWAAQNHVSLPTGPSPAAVSQKSKLEHLSGAAFDRAYLDDMLSDHQHDIKQVQQMAENAPDPQVKQLAARTLPFLEDHIRIAENAAGSMRLDASKGLNLTCPPKSLPAIIRVLQF
jgi:putative membrane protein